MTFRNYPTCHCHPQSFDSASTPKAFVKREQELGTGFVTVTDHGTLVATRQMYDLAKKAKITPILGLEAYFRDDNCPIFAKEGIPRKFYDPSVKKEAALAAAYPKGTYREYMKYAHVTMHFLDQQAYEAGIRILSEADLAAESGRDMGSERKPIFGWAQLEELGAQNVTMTTGCLVGIVQRHLVDHSRLDLAKAYYERLRSLVKPGNFYVEIFPHDCSRNWVDGVFLKMADGTELKFWAGKRLRTNAGELAAEELAKQWLKKEHPHRALIGICNARVWEDLTPVEITDVKHISEFMLNECRPWCADGDVQAGMNRVMMALAAQHGDKVLIADDSHFAHPEEKIVQDVRLGQMGNWKFYGSYHRQSSDEAFRYFSSKCEMPQAVFEQYVENSYEWAERFKDFKLKSEMSLPTKFYEVNYPQYSWFEKVPARDHSLCYTRELIQKHGRMDWNDPVYVERLKAEINLLHNNGIIDLLPYFFLDEEVCGVYERNGLITGPGRGSAAGLLLTYLLGITHVDPLKYELSMERFITVDRIKSGKLPDIDQDLPSRDLLVGVDDKVGWLEARFGDHFAQISVDSTLKLKMAVRDVARHKYGAVPDDVEFIAKKFAMPPQGVSDYDFVMGYDNDEGHVAGSIESDPALQEYVKRYPEDWKVVQKCLGLARQKGRHACAYVIAGRPIKEFIPLTKVSDVTVTSYTAGSVEAAGGLKMDFLVVNSLNDIGDAVQLIQKRHAFDPRDKYQVLEHEQDLVGWSGPRFTEKRFSLVIDGKRVPCQRLVPMGDRYYDVWDLPEDQDVFADVATGNTETCFQFNTPGAIQWLEHFSYKKPDGHYAIDSVLGMSAFTALDRPGPLDIMVGDPSTPDKKHNMLVEYARRARGEPGSKDVLPIFDQLIPETYGVMVYQEQLQRVYQNLTGCSGAEAEEFRTNVAKKKKELVDKAYPNFVEKAGQKIGEDNAKAAWEFFKTWGQYGFNKSHAVCYSIIGYVCAYLKHHYQLEWWTSVLKNADKNEINEKFWRYCGQMIDLPDVTLSEDVFTIQNERIRAPISLLQGIGAKAHEQICQYRPYTDIRDFCEKIEKHRMATGHTAEKEVLKKKKELAEGEVYKQAKQKKMVFVKGRSAISRKIVYTLILSGSMDSLFPEDGDGEVLVLDKLMRFEKAYAAALGKKKIESVSMKYTMVNAFQRFQMRKAILPMYVEDLVALMIEAKVPGVYSMEGVRADHTKYRAGMIKWGNGEREESVRFVNSTQLTVLNGDVLNFEPMRVAVAAYIDSQRIFNYGAGRQAVEILADVEGVKFKLVKWGGKTGLSADWTQSMEGSIVILILTKFATDKPFAIDDLIPVSPPIDFSEQSPDSPETGEEE